MDELIDSMKHVLADTFAFYLKTHNYHWNVEGPNFNDYHAFFLALYTETWGAVDLIAEHIRILDEKVPGSLGRFRELASVQDEIEFPSANRMFENLILDNTKVLNSLTRAYSLAERFSEHGLSNFLQDRIDIHKKHGWMLKSTAKQG